MSPCAADIFVASKLVYWHKLWANMHVPFNILANGAYVTLNGHLSRQRQSLNQTAMSATTNTITKSFK